MNSYYRHKNCRSVCVELIRIFYIPEGRLSLKISWHKWSPAKGVLYPLGYTHRIKISQKEWENNWISIKE